MSFLRVRSIWRVALLSLCLSALCVLTAVSLLRQQTALSAAMTENVASHKVATELEECLFDLILLLRHRVEAVSSLHDRVEGLLDRLDLVADQPTESLLAGRLRTEFDDYKRLWQAIPPVRTAGHEEGVREVARFLEENLLRSCREFEGFNEQRVADSAANQEQIAAWLSGGLAGVATLAGAAGVVLGFGVARGLRRSIARLRVQIRDAAGKIDRCPEIVLAEDGDFAELHEQIDRLSERIETVVQRLAERETEVLRAEQLAAVGQLAAGVAHEIRNPLTSIKLLAQSGLEDPDGLTAEDLQIMVREILRLERTLQTFLDFARPTKPERRRVEIAPLLADIVELIHGRADKQGITVAIDMPDGLPSLTADAGLLHQVLVNLTLNALDAMPTGGRLTLRVRTLPVDRIALEVIDTGPGLSAELLPRLFQPFVSGKDTGLGLGLVVSRRIVEAHGGTLTASNGPDRGAVFLVVLPAWTGIESKENPYVRPDRSRCGR